MGDIDYLVDTLTGVDMLYIVTPGVYIELSRVGHQDSRSSGNSLRLGSLEDPFPLATAPHSWLHHRKHYSKVDFLSHEITNV